MEWITRIINDDTLRDAALWGMLYLGIQLARVAGWAASENKFGRYSAQVGKIAHYVEAHYGDREGPAKRAVAVGMLREWSKKHNLMPISEEEAGKWFDSFVEEVNRAGGPMGSRPTGGFEVIPVHAEGAAL